MGEGTENCEARDGVRSTVSSSFSVPSPQLFSPGATQASMPAPKVTSVEFWMESPGALR